MAMRTYIVLGSALGLGLLAAHGCRYSDADSLHCGNNEGDAYCAEQFPDGSRPYCELGAGSCISSEAQLGCMAERPADECYSPCGGRGTIIENGDCVMMEDSSSGSSSGGTETEESSGSSDSSTTGPVPCMGNEDCPDVAAPLCEPVSGECVTCDAFGAEGDAACADLDPMAPLCVNGACVTCTPENPVVCDDQLLLCDGGTNTCIQCTEHAQCSSGACELAVGRCFPEDFVVHVDGDAGAMPVPDYTSISAAVDAVDQGMHGVIIVHELDMDASYQAAVTIDGAKTVALLAAPGESPRIQGTGGNPGLQVAGAGTIIYMDGLRLRSGDALGLEVNGAFAWVDRSRIVQNTGGGVLAQGGADIRLRNCFVGGSVNNVPALAVNGATAAITYVTSGAGFGTATALSCDPGATVDVRNSLLVSEDAAGDEVQCPNASIEHSAAELDLGGTNTALGDMNTSWFVGYGTGDFSLSAMHPVDIDTAAQWTTGDPTTDIDADPRPTVDGTADFAGADAVP